MRLRYLVWSTAILLCTAMIEARGQDDAPPPRDVVRFDRRAGSSIVCFESGPLGSPGEIVIPPVRLDGEPQSGFEEVSATEHANERLRFSTQRLGPKSVALTWTTLDDASQDFTIAIGDNSAYYGCGERFGSLNHKGMILPMVSIDRPEDKGVVTYKPVPFYMSRRGYAAWLDSFAPGSFDLNATDRDHVLLKYRAASLRLVLIEGPDMAAMLNEYTRLSGRPRVPPAWSFAPWKSRNVHHNRDEVLADAELTRRHDLPGSVIVIDSPWETGYNDFVLNEKQFTEPEKMFARLRELGFHTCLWLTPFVNDQNLVDMKGIGAGPSANFSEGERLGYFVKRPDGAPMLASWWKGRGALVDFTNPDAVTWWHGQIDKAAKWGFRAIKCDDGEGNFIQDAIFHDGTTAAEMKNRYAVLYLRAAQAYLDSRFDGDGVLFARCGFSGTQQYPHCWAGDNDASFSFENGLPTVILAGQNAALSGLPLWGHDIAGYSGTQTPELFIRWTQFGALSPVMQVHMTSNLGPWDFGEEALAIYRKFSRLHTSLFPYIRDAAHEASRTGMPIIRPMVLAFPNDLAAAHHRYQYMFGPELLVAPMYQPGTHRSVYLPSLEGGRTWMDYWSGAALKGGLEMEVHAPLDRMPIFVRSGAVICMLPEDVDTLIARSAEMSSDVVAIDDRRIIQVWPGSPGSLPTTDGITAKLETAGNHASLRLSSSTPRSIEVRRMFAKPTDLNGDGAPQDAWTFDNENRYARRTLNVGPEPITLAWQSP